MKAPKIENNGDLNYFWRSWKGSYSQKVLRWSKTGGPGRQTLTECDNIIKLIFEENPTLQKNRVHRE